MLTEDTLTLFFLLLLYLLRLPCLVLLVLYHLVKVFLVRLLIFPACFLIQLSACLILLLHQLNLLTEHISLLVERFQFETVDGLLVLFLAQLAIDIALHSRQVQLLVLVLHLLQRLRPALALVFGLLFQIFLLQFQTVCLTDLYVGGDILVIAFVLRFHGIDVVLIVLLAFHIGDLQTEDVLFMDFSLFFEVCLLRLCIDIIIAMTARSTASSGRS